MEHSLARERYTRQDDEVGQLAVNLLAYAAMGAEDALHAITMASPGITLGQVMVVWYQMCEGAAGKDHAAQLARQTAQSFHNSMTEIVEGEDADTPAVKHRSVAYSIARGLLIDLAVGELERFAELWESTMNFDLEVIMETVALMLGFTRGILDAMVSS